MQQGNVKNDKPEISNLFNPNPKILLLNEETVVAHEHKIYINNFTNHSSSAFSNNSASHKKYNISHELQIIYIIYCIQFTTCFCSLQFYRKQIFCLLKRDSLSLKSQEVETRG